MPVLISCSQMDNALIDDRRIHVDFSQSVAKLWSSYRRGGKNQGVKGLKMLFAFTLLMTVSDKEQT